MTKVPATKKIQSSPASGALWPFYASDLLTQVSLPSLVKAVVFSRRKIGISLQTNKGRRGGGGGAGKKNHSVIKLSGDISVAISGWLLVKTENASQNGELGHPISQ